MKPAVPAISVNYDGTLLNIYHVNKGEGLPQHVHTYSHATMCFAGSCAVYKQGKQKILTKDDAPVNLVAGEWHEIEALEDGTIFCNMFAESKL